MNKIIAELVTTDKKLLNTIENALNEKEHIVHSYSDKYIIVIGETK